MSLRELQAYYMSLVPGPVMVERLWESLEELVRIGSLSLEVAPDWRGHLSDPDATVRLWLSGEDRTGPPLEDE